MPGQQSSLTALKVRKELLIAEAEVLRTQLGHDLEVIHQGFTAWGDQAKSVASYASVAATVLAGVSEFRRVRKGGCNGKASFLSTFLTGARTASAVWQTLRSRQD